LASKRPSSRIGIGSAGRTRDSGDESGPDALPGLDPNQCEAASLPGARSRWGRLRGCPPRSLRCGRPGCGRPSLVPVLAAACGPCSVVCAPRAGREVAPEHDEQDTGSHDQGQGNGNPDSHGLGKGKREEYRKSRGRVEWPKKSADIPMTDDDRLRGAVQAQKKPVRSLMQTGSSSTRGIQPVQQNRPPRRQGGSREEVVTRKLTWTPPDFRVETCRSGRPQSEVSFHKGVKHPVPHRPRRLRVRLHVRPAGPPARGRGHVSEGASTR